MTREDSITKIEAACKVIALEMMKVTPTARHLDDEATTADIVTASYKLTIELEVIKKKLIQLKGNDDSTIL